MKKLLTPIALLCFFQTSWGQITLTSSLGYVPGDAYNAQPCSSTVDMPSLPGANVTVNFGTLTTIGSVNAISYTDPATTPYSSDFPDATVCLSALSTQGQYTYTYMVNDGSTVELLGLANSQVNMPYSNPQLMLSFPTSYNNSFDDNFSADVTVSGVDIKRRGTIHSVADAYGSITTPTGTYSYLRLKISQTIIDSSFFMGDFMQATTTQTVTYNYMNDLVKCPILSYSESSNGTQSATNAYYYVSGAVGIKEQSSAIVNEMVYPNPAKNNVTVSFDLKAAQHTTFKVYDITGKLATASFSRELAPGKHSMPIDISTLSPGLYSIVIESPEQGSSAVKFMVD